MHDIEAGRFRYARFPDFKSPRFDFMVCSSLTMFVGQNMNAFIDGAVIRDTAIAELGYGKFVFFSTGKLRLKTCCIVGSFAGISVAVAFVEAAK